MPGKILAVDDERDLLTLLRRIVTGETDCEIVTETDPLSALELVKSTHFDIVFVDLKMPRMDGLTLLREIKKYRPRCTVVILTAMRRWTPGGGHPPGSLRLPSPSPSRTSASS